MSLSDGLIGRTVAHYRVEHLIGQGGMAKVYYGWDEKLQRPVAIKVIDPRYQGNRSFVERFTREANTLAAWQHPNILNIYYSGQVDGTPYYVMEYVHGQDLRRLIHKYREAGQLMPQAEILRIARAIAAALDYAHGRGVIHRDIKPSNVLVANDGRVALTDFGLALDVTQETQGEVFGSPQYISPEQARTSANAVPESDLYSLGVMLYEMLTGSLPFTESSPASLALQHITQEPPPPRQINPRLNHQVEAVLLQALRKNPAERFRSAQELVDALQRALGSGPAAQAADADITPATLPVLVNPPTASLNPSFDRANTHPHAGGRPVSLPTYRPVPQAAGSSRLVRWAVGCSAIVVLTALALAIAVALAFGQEISSAGSRATPTGVIAVIDPPTATFTPEPSTTPQPSYTATGTLVPSPTPSFTPTPTQTPTQTPPSSPTATPTNTPTPTLTEAALRIPRLVKLMLVTRRDDSFFVVNAGEEALPLSLLALGTEEHHVFGSEWELDYLEPGQCVALWKNSGNPLPPENLECDLVGKRLERNNKARFWTKNYMVVFDEVLVEICTGNDPQCDIEFSPASGGSGGGDDNGDD